MEKCTYCVQRIRRAEAAAVGRPAGRAGGGGGRRLQYNAGVTGGTRGVMEKCTYWVQRIRGAEADAVGRPAEMAGGVVRLSVQTACQQACPARAIVFGDLNDPDAEARHMKAD